MSLVLTADHRYILDGRELPSVTHVINGVMPPRECDPWYLSRGSALHAAIHLEAAGTLDHETLDPAYLRKFTAFERFRAEVKPEFIVLEEQLASKRYNFAGTVDAVARIGEYHAIIDWKSSIQPTVDLQLGGYSILLCENCRPVRRAVAVELKNDGTFGMRPLAESELAKAERIFLATLSVYGWMRKNGIIKRTATGREGKQ